MHGCVFTAIPKFDTACNLNRKATFVRDSSSIGNQRRGRKVMNRQPVVQHATDTVVHSDGIQQPIPGVSWAAVRLLARAAIVIQSHQERMQE
jgi:hypothetical protein